jgi:predicted nuclease of predicted toxin-antitoxin system
VLDEIRFLFDEHFPATVVVGLRQRGLDVLTIKEAKRAGLSDFEQLQFAAANERVLVTFDTDFLRIAAQGTQHAGIVWCPARKYGIGDLIRRLMLVHTVLLRDDMLNVVEYL